MKKSMVSLQMAGFIFTGIVGTLLHFLYDWTGQSPVAGIFSAVNESIWEHMKLLFYPMLLFAVFEYFVIGKNYSHFWCVKALGTLLGLALIPTLYYTYTGSLGISVDWLNIAIFYIAAGTVFWLETRLLQRDFPRCRYPKAAFMLLIGLAFLFGLWTFFPPGLPIFQPPEKM